MLLGFFTLNQHQNYLEGLLKQIAGSLPGSGSVCTESRVGLENLCLLGVPRRCRCCQSGDHWCRVLRLRWGMKLSGFESQPCHLLTELGKCLNIHTLWCSSVKHFADITCIVGFLGRLTAIVCIKCLKYVAFATMVMR